jgi:hypothetical protein
MRLELHENIATPLAFLEVVPKFALDVKSKVSRKHTSRAATLAVSGRLVR